MPSRARPRACSCGRRTVWGLARGAAAFPGPEQVCGAGRRAGGVGSGPSPGLRLRPRGCGAPAPPASPSARRERQGLDGVAGPVAGKSRDGWHPARSGEGGGGWALLLAGRADFLPAWTLLPLSRRPGLESPTWLPQSPDTRRTVYTIPTREPGQVGVSGPFPRTRAPSLGQALDSLTGAWAA